MSAIGRFEAELLALIRANAQGLLDAIRTREGDLTPEIEAKLKSILEQFTKSFA